MCEMFVLRSEESTAAVLLEGKSNPLRMRQEIPLTEAEIAALDDGVSALDSLLTRLENIPTASGKTPLQIREQSLVQIEAPNVWWPRLDRTYARV